MGLTFDQLKKRIGTNLKYYNGTTWLTDRDVTETEIGDMINEIYRDEVFPIFATQYPQDFQQTGLANSWIANGTVDATSTSTTLVATTSIFTNAMVGLYVWNDTDSERAKITAYTSGTTVTLDTTIDNDWDGDSIYVLGQEFTFGGDATDLYVLSNVGIKYNDTNDYYTRAQVRFKDDFYDYGNEVGDEANPYFYETTITVGSTLTSGIGLIPQFSKKITNGLEVTYIKKPTALSSSGDTLRLPVDTPVIYGATARAYEIKQDLQTAAYWTSKYEMSKRTAIARYRPLSTRENLKIRPPRRASYLHNRYI